MHFRFRDVPRDGRDWWLIMEPAGTEVCDFDPGYPLAATVEAELRSLTRVWRGDLSWRDAIRSGAVEVVGSTQARRAVPRWLGQSRFAAVPRPVAAPMRVSAEPGG